MGARVQTTRRLVGAAMNPLCHHVSASRIDWHIPAVTEVHHFAPISDLEKAPLLPHTASNTASPVFTSITPVDMQTRRKAQQQAATAVELPQLPIAVQTAILDLVVALYPVPDVDEYELWPYRSSIGWLLTLRRVSSSWNQHLQQHPMVRRRIRLERLRNLSLVHDYAYFVTSRDVPKHQRIKQVPRSLCLQFADGSSTTFAVPKGGVVGAGNKRLQSGLAAAAMSMPGLPTHALVIIACCHTLTSAALSEMLADLSTLDRNHAAPIVMQVCHSCSDTAQDEHAAAVCQETAQAETCCGSCAALESAAVPLVTGALRDVVMEGGASHKALTFIPTNQSFCRRIPAA